MTAKKPKNPCPYHPNAELVRHGRADWRCPVDGKNMMLDLVLIEQAKQKGSQDG